MWGCILRVALQTVVKQRWNITNLLVEFPSWDKLPDNVIERDDTNADETFNRLSADILKHMFTAM